MPDKPRKVQFLDVVLAVLLAALIAWSIRFFIKEANFRHYSFLFAHLPPKAILIRYYFSISLRIFLIISCIGVLLRKKFFRFALIFYAIFTILTVYWKHPYATFERIYNAMLRHGNIPASMAAKLPFLTLVTVINNYAIDIGISVLLILLLTNRKIARQFT